MFKHLFFFYFMFRLYMYMMNYRQERNNSLLQAFVDLAISIIDIDFRLKLTQFFFSSMFFLGLDTN